jgi:hypothetical protein
MSITDLDARLSHLETRRYARTNDYRAEVERALSTRVAASLPTNVWRTEAPVSGLAPGRDAEQIAALHTLTRSLAAELTEIKSLVRVLMAEVQGTSSRSHRVDVAAALALERETELIAQAPLERARRQRSSTPEGAPGDHAPVGPGPRKRSIVEFERRLRAQIGQSAFAMR